MDFQVFTECLCFFSLRSSCVKVKVCLVSICQFAPAGRWRNYRPSCIWKLDSYFLIIWDVYCSFRICFQTISTYWVTIIQSSRLLHPNLVQDIETCHPAKRVECKTNHLQLQTPLPSPLRCTWTITAGQAQLSNTETLRWAECFSNSTEVIKILPFPCVLWQHYRWGWAGIFHHTYIHVLKGRE